MKLSSLRALLSADVVPLSHAPPHSLCDMLINWIGNEGSAAVIDALKRNKTLTTHVCVYAMTLFGKRICSTAIGPVLLVVQDISVRALS